MYVRTSTPKRICTLKQNLEKIEAAKRSAYCTGIYSRNCYFLFPFPFFPACVWKDQNVRYVALQCLGQVTTLRLSAIEANLDMLIGSMDAVMNEKDSQIVLHTLR